jgi:periplasmic copper chaperone A
MQMQLPPTPGALWFRVLQVCESGRNDWSEIPASGTVTRGLKAPAALLEVTPPAAASSPQPASRSADVHKH